MRSISRVKARELHSVQLGLGQLASWKGELGDIPSPPCHILMERVGQWLADFLRRGHYQRRRGKIEQGQRLITHGHLKQGKKSLLWRREGDLGQRGI